jgi:hypothetical protein
MPKQDETEKDPRPLNAAELKFATMYVKFRDIYKAAERSRIPRTQAVKTFNKTAVQEEIDRQMEVVRVERARQQVQDENLTNQLLDKAMIALLTDPKTSDSLRLEALRLGYVVTGKIQAGSTKVLDGAPAAGDEDRGAAPFSYRAVVQVSPSAPAAAAAAVAAPILPQENVQNVQNPTAANLTPDVKPLSPAPAVRPTAPAVPPPKQQRPPFARRDSNDTIKLG